MLDRRQPFIDRLRDMARPFARFCSARSGIAAVETALVLPLFLLFLLAGSETARYINTARVLTNLANSMASLVAERTTGFSFLEAVYTYDSALVSFPHVMKDAAQKGVPWNYDIAITVSSVVFTPMPSGCTSGCTYSAKVAWSINMPIAQQRSCTVAPTSTSDTAPPSMTTLPADIFTAGSVIVADIVYTYMPLFGSKLIPTITIRRTVYMQPRYMTSIPYNTIPNDPYSLCPTS